MSFVRSWWVGLWTTLIANLLLKYNNMEFSLHSFNSFINLCNHVNSHIPCTRDLNFALTLLFFFWSEPWYYFLQQQIASYSFELWVAAHKCAIARCWSSITSRTYLSISVKASIFLNSFLRKNNPFSDVPFRYLRIQWTTSRCSSYGLCMNWLIILIV